MAIAAIISTIGAAVGVASNIVSLIEQIRAAKSALGEDDKKKLEKALTVMGEVPNMLEEMRATLEEPAQKTVLERDDRPELEKALETVTDQVSFLLQQMKSTVESLDVTGQQISSDQVDRMRKRARDIINSLDLKSDSDVRKALERKNLFTLGLLVDNIGVFEKRDFDVSKDDVLDKLSRNGRFTTSIRSYEDQL